MFTFEFGDLFEDFFDKKKETSDFAAKGKRRNQEWGESERGERRGSAKMPTTE